MSLKDENDDIVVEAAAYDRGAEQVVGGLNVGSVSENDVLGDEDLTIDQSLWYLFNVGVGDEARVHYRRRTVRTRIEVGCAQKSAFIDAVLSGKLGHTLAVCPW